MKIEVCAFLQSGPRSLERLREDAGHGIGLLNDALRDLVAEGRIAPCDVTEQVDGQPVQRSGYRLVEVDPTQTTPSATGTATETPPAGNGPPGRRPREYKGYREALERIQAAFGLDEDMEPQEVAAALVERARSEKHHQWILVGTEAVAIRGRFDILGSVRLSPNDIECYEWRLGPDYPAIRGDAAAVDLAKDAVMMITTGLDEAAVKR